jgi:cyclic-di-GMP-binding protein
VLEWVRRGMNRIDGIARKSQAGVWRAVADNHSFDVVSEINHAEMHNAVVQAQHEIAVRYDFKGTKAGLEFDKKENTLKLTGDHKGQLEAVLQVLKERMVKRGIAVNALKRGKMEEATHDSVRETISMHVGIDADTARKFVKEIKGLGVKVQSQIMDNKIRVTGKKKDDLQVVMAYLKENSPDIPLQFNNFT